MYRRVVSGRAEADICFAPWGEGIGQPADFAWLDTMMERMLADVAGPIKVPAASQSNAKRPGLEIWRSSTKDDGTKDLQEIVKISRDPLPAAMFTLPADYKEISRPLSATERVPRGPAATAPSLGASARRASSPSSSKVSGIVAILLSVVLIVGLLIHAAILHLAANLVLEHAGFVQALVATIIVWAVMIAAELLHLPRAIGLGVGVLAIFAGLKIAYSASVPRTFALFALSVVIAAIAGWGAGSIASLVGVR